MPTLENRISGAIDAAAKAAIEAAVASLRTNMPFIINLDPDERKKKRKTGSKREGYVVAVHDASLAHPDAIPATFNMPEWVKDEALNTALKGVFSLVGSVSESINDTLLQIGSERIKQADACYDYLKQGAAGNVALTDELNRIAQQFLGQGRRADVPITSIPAGGSVTINNAVPNTRLSNMGETVLKMTANNTETLIRPGDVALVPVKQIRVDNQSTTAAGSFSVKTK